MRRIYLDNAATTPLDADVIAEMTRVMEDTFGNPSAIHCLGREARTIIENERKRIAKYINASPAEIFFTSGGTEADNMAIKMAVKANGLKRIITSEIEHHAVEHTCKELLRDGVINTVEYVKLNEEGGVDYEDLERLLANGERALVTLMHANNELGTLTDIERVGELCRQYNALFHCDTVQTVGHYRHDVQKCNVDFMVCSAHKLHGPKGVGFIYIAGRNKIPAFINGGAQERNMRGGTENIYGIAGLGKSLEKCYNNLEEHHAYIQGLKSYMMEELKSNFIDVRFNGNTTPEGSLYTVLNVSFPPSEMGDMLLFNLDINGVCASGGSACSSGSDIGSHVLKAINADAQRPAVRFSFSKYNTRADIDDTIAILKKVYGRA